MIQEKSGFWDSIDPTPGNSGDERTYNAGEMTTPFEYLVTNGVHTGGAFLQVTPGSYDYSSQVAPGMAWIKGRWYLLRDDGTGGATKRILLHDAPIQYNRIDRVVLRYDANYTLSGRKIVAAVLKGVEAASPVAPALTRNDEIYELSLARVLIKPGQPIIIAADITDERFDSALCGIAEFAPQPDLQPYIEQFQQRLNDVFGDIEALDAAAITSGVLNAARLPLSSAVDDASETQAATSKAVKSVNDKAVALQDANKVWPTGGTAPNFTVADATVTAYGADLRRTVKFHTAGTAVTLNFNGKGARSLYEYPGKAANVKAGQIVTVWYDGANFFTVSGGGAGELVTEIITASQTWNKPSDIIGDRIFVRLFGAGGGGGSGSSGGFGNGGGGGGHMNTGFVPVSALGSVVAISIGAGGAGATSADVYGSTGGLTSFGAFLAAAGGAGGASSNIYQTHNGGSGGSGGGAAGGSSGVNGSGGAGSYGGGGGNYSYYNDVSNRGGTYGGGGGTNGGAPTPGGTYGGASGANGINTTGIAVDFTGDGLCMAVGNRKAGGGGYGGRGGTVPGAGDYGGSGGGGYGANGGNAVGVAGGGGGGYGGAGGNGGSGQRGGGGGGGGYGIGGTGGKGGDDSNNNVTAGGIAAGGGGAGWTGGLGIGGAGGNGICIIQYYK